MKKTLSLLIAALVCMVFPGCEREEVKHEETVQPLFSVAEGHQVLFSPGNLQFCTLGSHATAEGTASGTSASPSTSTTTSGRTTPWCRTLTAAG